MVDFFNVKCVGTYTDRPMEAIWVNLPKPSQCHLWDISENDHTFALSFIPPKWLTVTCCWPKMLQHSKRQGPQGYNAPRYPALHDVDCQHRALAMSIMAVSTFLTPGISRGSKGQGSNPKNRINDGIYAS